MADSFVERNGTTFQILAALVIAVGGWLLQRWYNNRDLATKTFDYMVVSDLPIVANAAVSDKLKVLYENREVRNPRILQVRFKNTGNQPIRAVEFLQPCILRIFGADLIDVSIVDGLNLASINTSYGHDPAQGSVSLAVNTLNPGDSFTVQLVIDGPDSPAVEVANRIEGQTRDTAHEKAIQRIELARSLRRWIWGSVVMLVFLVSVAVLVLPRPKDIASAISTFLIILYFVSSATWLVSLVLRLRMLYQIGDRTVPWWKVWAWFGSP